MDRGQCAEVQEQGTRQAEAEEKHLVCPLCGSSIVADVVVWYRRVPIDWDGYWPGDGDFVEDEVKNIVCTNGLCGAEVDIESFEPPKVVVVHKQDRREE